MMKKRKRFKRLWCLFFLLAAVLSGFLVYHFYRNDRKCEERFEQLETWEEEREQSPVPQTVSQKEENPDWIGWLKIENTSISYPVMQRKGG